MIEENNSLERENNIKKLLMLFSYSYLQEREVIIEIAKLMSQKEKN